MSNISKRRKEGSKTKIKSMGDHKEFLKRITKTLYYGELPTLPCLSLPVTEISCEVWSVSQRGRSLRRLHADAAAGLARSACVSPCALVLALLYLERLHACNPDYIAATAPADLFLVSLFDAAAGLARSACVSPCALVLALLYLERLHACNPDYIAATAPADLFLVSLMVGNKFLQDDGEDDEVICSEWAASGGMDLDQLKKLELEFLIAIDWNVFVSEKSFEAGLRWLERNVALRQARLRGFFTYGDLAAAASGAPALDELARAAAAGLALAVAALASTLALLGSALLLTKLTAPGTSPAQQTNVLPDAPLGNATLDEPSFSLDDLPIPDIQRPTCCQAWTDYRDSAEPKRSWFDGFVFVYDWRSLEPWWSRTLLNWLYQSSLVNPVQRWLEKIGEYADLVRRTVGGGAGAGAGCAEWGGGGGGGPPNAHCVRQWLDLSKLNALVASLSDR